MKIHIHKTKVTQRKFHKNKNYGMKYRKISHVEKNIHIRVDRKVKIKNS